MRGVTSVIVQTHQILRLPRKMNLMIDPCHTWNAICNARSNKCHCPNSPNTAPATKNESHDWSLSHMKCYLQCAEQQVSLSKLTKYCACHEKWISWLILVTHETLFTMRGATSVIVQTHQILRLPRKMNLMIDPCHTWNAIYNARSNMRHSPNSPNTAPATKNDRPESQRNLLKTDETSFPMRGRSENDPRMIRAWSEHDPSMIRPWNRQSATRLATEVTFHAHHEHFVLKNTTFRAPAIIPNFTEYCACHEKWHSNFTKYCACHEKRISWLILVAHETLFTMRGATSVIVQTHQILRLPRKMNLMIDPWHKWNVIYNARSNMRHSPNSPNTAPATKNDRPESQRNLLKTDETSFPMRGRSDHDPRMIRAWSEHDPSMIRPWSDHETVSPQPASQPRLPFTPTTSILYWKIQHFALRLSFQISPNTAPATKSDTRTSPNTAPATKKESHDWSLSHMKRYLQCAEQQVSLSKLTKYCACHAKFDPWHKWNVIYNARSNMRHSPNSPNTAPATKNDCPESQRNLLKTDETSFPMRGRSDHDPRMIRAWSEHDPSMIRPWSDHETVSPQPASQPRLPFTPTTSILYWKIQHFALRLSFQISPNTAPATKSDTWTSPNTAPATKSDTCTSPNTAPATKSDTSTSPNTAPAMKIELWLDWAMTWLLWLDWAVTWLAMTWLSCDLTELWRDWAVTWLSYYWAVTWLSCDVTELWLDWAVTWLSCNLTELWRDWAVTWLSCDLTELWLDWAVTWLAVTWLSCDLTELWRDWAVTWLSYDLTELWLDWAVTWLSCELWRDWAVTWLSCDLTELWLDWAVTWLSWDAMSFVYRNFLNLNFLR